MGKTGVFEFFLRFLCHLWHLYLKSSQQKTIVKSTFDKSTFDKYNNPMSKFFAREAELAFLQEKYELLS
mgnify:CR=1 FL=1